MLMCILFHQVSVTEWAQAEATFNLCEVLFKVHKVFIISYRPPQQMNYQL